MIVVVARNNRNNRFKILKFKLTGAGLSTTFIQGEYIVINIFFPATVSKLLSKVISFLKVMFKMFVFIILFVTREVKKKKIFFTPSKRSKTLILLFILHRTSKILYFL